MAEPKIRHDPRQLRCASQEGRSDACASSRYPRSLISAVTDGFLKAHPRQLLTPAEGFADASELAGFRLDAENQGAVVTGLARGI
jgi:hypothetical protein